MLRFPRSWILRCIGARLAAPVYRPEDQVELLRFAPQGARLLLGCRNGNRDHSEPVLALFRLALADTDPVPKLFPGTGLVRLTVVCPHAGARSNKLAVRGSVTGSTGNFLAKEMTASPKRAVRSSKSNRGLEALPSSSVSRRSLMCASASVAYWSFGIRHWSFTSSRRPPSARSGACRGRSSAG